MDLGDRRASLLDDCGRRLHHFLIELTNPACSPWPDRHLDIRQAQGHITELWTRRVTAQLIPPGTRHRDMTPFGRPTKGGIGEPLLHPPKPGLQRIQVWNHHPDMTSENLGVTRREMKLLLADIHPHIARPDHHIRVARKPEARDIECRSNRLVRDRDIDVFHAEHIADILRSSIIFFLILHGLSSFLNTKSEL